MPPNQVIFGIPWVGDSVQAETMHEMEFESVDQYCEVRGRIPTALRALASAVLLACFIVTQAWGVSLIGALSDACPRVWRTMGVRAVPLAGPGGLTGDVSSTRRGRP